MHYITHSCIVSREMLFGTRTGRDLCSQLAVSWYARSRSIQPLYFHTFLFLYTSDSEYNFIHQICISNPYLPLIEHTSYLSNVNLPMEYNRLHRCFYGYVLYNIHKSKMHTARQFKLYNIYAVQQSCRMHFSFWDTFQQLRFARATRIPEPGEVYNMKVLLYTTFRFLSIVSLWKHGWVWRVELGLYN